MVKVISFCLWNNIPRYTVGLVKNIELASKLYPDWECWAYIHKRTVPEDFVNSLKKYDNVKIILKHDDAIRSKRFMLWRFEPCIDPLVTHCAPRDTDTRIMEREVLAVKEWIESGKTLHIMRDHPQHYPKILGGMFGIKTDGLPKDKDWIKSIEDFYTNNGEETDDQTFLELYVYPLYVNDRIIHDEIKRYEGDECKKYPIRYTQDGRFIGGYVYEDDSVDPATTYVMQHFLNNNPGLFQ